MPGRLLRHNPGHQIRFRRPGNGEGATGSLVDEVWVPDPETFAEVVPDRGDGWLETAFVAQLIDWGGGNLRVRFAYYTRRPGMEPNGWVFAQFCPSLGRDEYVELINKICDKHWFD